MTAETKPKITIDAGRLKHLEMLQQTITRMANNSFLIKGWSITLISALLAFATKDKISIMAWVALLPWLTFWVLDGYFLHQERLFRQLFDRYRKEAHDTPTDFSMNTQVVREAVAPVQQVIFSKTLIIFHGFLGTLIIAIIALAHWGLITSGSC